MYWHSAKAEVKGSSDSLCIVSHHSLCFSILLYFSILVHTPKFKIWQERVDAVERLDVFKNENITIHSQSSNVVKTKFVA